mmetsp:Transcript_39302/g.34810  ORF Transcript_39302/g.34810 Transcript_39302/m.34810 type:complete len:114 (-) Transcript_39302:93-434(-)
MYSSHATYKPIEGIDHKSSTSQTTNDNSCFGCNGKLRIADKFCPECGGINPKNSKCNYKNCDNNAIAVCCYIDRCEMKCTKLLCKVHVRSKQEDSEIMCPDHAPLLVNCCTIL